MKTLSLKLPAALHARLGAFAKRRNCTKSDVVREALEAILNPSNRQRKGTCLELAGDLAGCLEGPVDLSFNKKQMEGYGQ